MHLVYTHPPPPSPSPPPKFVITVITVVPREIKDNGYAFFLLGAGAGGKEGALWSMLKWIVADVCYSELWRKFKSSQLTCTCHMNYSVCFTVHCRVLLHCHLPENKVFLIYISGAKSPSCFHPWSFKQHKLWNLKVHFITFSIISITGTCAQNKVIIL